MVVRHCMLRMNFGSEKNLDGLVKPEVHECELSGNLFIINVFRGECGRKDFDRHLVMHWMNKRDRHHTQQGAAEPWARGVRRQTLSHRPVRVAHAVRDSDGSFGGIV